MQFRTPHWSWFPKEQKQKHCEAAKVYSRAYFEFAIKTNVEQHSNDTNSLVLTSKLVIVVHMDTAMFPAIAENTHQLHN